MGDNLESKQPNSHGCLTAVLLGLALFLSFFAFIGRVDSSEEARTARTLDWIILGPLWASVVFLGVRAALGRSAALSAAFITWVTVALAFNWLEDEKELSRHANCLVNLKQIGLAVAMYADEYQGRCPMDSANPTLLGSMQLLTNTITSPKLLRCPRDPRPSGQAQAEWRNVTVRDLSYSYVPNLKWSDTPDSPLALDRIYSTSAGSLWPANGNHKGQGGNVLFNDGHVCWQNRLPSALKDESGKEIVLSP